MVCTVGLKSGVHGFEKVVGMVDGMVDDPSAGLGGEDVEYDEADKFRDIEVLYDEVDYTVNTKIETEVRSRQVPVPYEHKETETKY